jgi:EmrB/QacA subfamily drug resistance transporter
MAAALPTIEQDLGTDLTTVQWVMNAYLIAFGLSIVTGGWLADRLGRRRVLLVGLAGFGAFAFVAGLAPSVGLLIPARALQGLAAGFIWPSVLAIAFTAVGPDRRVVAVGLALGAAGLGEALGPLIGGVVTDDVSWRAILLAKPVLALAAGIACARALADDARAGPARVDFAGIAALSLALLALLYALDEATTLGWGSPVIVGCLFAAVLCAAAFLLIERRREEPLVPREALHDREVLGSCLLMTTTAPMFFVALLYVPQILAKDLGFDPMETGLGMLPMQVLFALVAPICGFSAARFGLRGPHVVGLLVMAASAFAFSRYGAGEGYAALLPAMVLYGVGVGLAYPAVTALMLTSFGAERAGLAAGLLFMVELVLGGLATAVATTVVWSATGLTTGLESAFIGVAVLAAAGALLAALLSPGRAGPAAAPRLEASR